VNMLKRTIDYSKSILRLYVRCTLKTASAFHFDFLNVYVSVTSRLQNPMKNILNDDIFRKLSATSYH